MKRLNAPAIISHTGKIRSNIQKRFFNSRRQKKFNNQGWFWSMILIFWRKWTPLCDQNGRLSRRYEIITRILAVFGLQHCCLHTICWFFFEKQAKSLVSLFYNLFNSQNCSLTKRPINLFCSGKNAVNDCHQKYSIKGHKNGTRTAFSAYLNRFFIALVVCASINQQSNSRLLIIQGEGIYSLLTTLKVLNKYWS